MAENIKTPKPFLKWAGGKTQLLPEISKKYPEKVKKYCEPFLGGGAVLFDIITSKAPEKILVNDINPELINTYKAVKTHSDELIKALSGLQESFYETAEEEKQTFYLSQRTRFNEIKLEDTVNIEKASLFIFLNKTCFNGLYRVNSKGLFNVPWNKSKKPLICDTENLQACSLALQNVEFNNGLYSECEDFIDKDTFVYFDPPYRPLSDSSSFTSYNENGFGDDQQKELAEFVKKLAKKDIKILASNSDPKNTAPEDNFFDDLYSPLKIERVQATRMINRNSNGRGNINELLISNS